MTLAPAPERPRTDGRRKLWIAIAVATLAVVVAALVLLGDRSRPSSEARGVRGGLSASTPSRDAANAVDAVPALDAVGPGAFGGPGSAADGSMGALETERPQVVAERSRSRSRQQPPRRRAERQAPAETPTYRAIGPTADEAPEPPPQT